MKVILGLVVIACMLAAVSAQSLDCIRRTAETASCATQLISPGSDFCDDCGSSLISFYKDCGNGIGVDQVEKGKLDYQPLYTIMYATT